MRVLKLEIRKHDQYGDDYQGEIVGMVQIVGDTGKMEVRLHPGTVAKIFRMCREDVQRVAAYNAQQAAGACDMAAGAIELQVENQELKQITDG